MYPYLSSTAISENSRNDRNSSLSVRLSPISLHDDGGFIFTLRFSKAKWWVKENNLYEIVGQVTYAWLRTANHNPCIECRSLLVSSHMQEFHYKMFCFGHYLTCDDRMMKTKPPLWWKNTSYCQTGGAKFLWCLEFSEIAVKHEWEYVWSILLIKKKSVAHISIPCLLMCEIIIKKLKINLSFISILMVSKVKCFAFKGWLCWVEIAESIFTPDLLVSSPTLPTSASPTGQRKHLFSLRTVDVNLYHRENSK